MNHVRLAALSAVLAFTLVPVESAESAPGSPIDMEVEYCWDDDCYDMYVSLQADGSFIDSDGDEGVWFYRPDDREMLLRWTGAATGVEFYGIRTGDCVAGRTYFEGEADAVWVGCRL